MMPAQVEVMRETRRNERRLPGVTLARKCRTSRRHRLRRRGRPCAGGAPAQSYRTTAAAMRGHLRQGSVVVSCAKGIEKEVGLYMSEVLAEMLPGQPVAALSGPSFAVDLARGLPTAVTLAAQSLSNG